MTDAGRWSRGRLAEYVYELYQQCELSLYAHTQLMERIHAERARRKAMATVQGPSKEIDFYADAMVTHAARVARLLVPHPRQENDKFARERAAQLALVVREDCWFIDSRKVRDAIDHYDEKLDSFAAHGAAYLDRTDEPGQTPEPSVPRLRWLDYDSLVYTTVGGELDLGKLAGSLIEIENAATIWLYGTAAWTDEPDAKAIRH